MPASIHAIMKNVERMADDPELLALWNAEATDERPPGLAWTAFVAAADVARIADRIPGTVGRTFKAKYAAEDVAKAVTGQPAAKRATAKRPTAKRPAKKATK